MKFWLAVIAIVAIICYFYFPIINTERMCYETSQKLTDQISSTVLNYSLSLNDKCSRMTNVLTDLESCVHSATASSTVAQYTNGTIQNVVAIIRPYANNLWTLKANHNQECTNFENDQLP